MVSAFPPYAIRGGRPGRERLRILAGVLEPATRALFGRIGIPDGASIHDAG